MVIDQRADERFVLGETSQTGCVVGQSIMTIVDFGDDNTDHLPFSSGHARLTVEHCSIQIDMCTQSLWVQAVHLQNVVNETRAAINFFVVEF